MQSVSVSELKAHLSRYLRMVKRGSEVQVVERGTPVARLIGLARVSADSDRERVARLTEAGVLRRGSGDLRWLLDEPVRGETAADVAGALDEDREDRV